MNAPASHSPVLQAHLAVTLAVAATAALAPLAPASAEAAIYPASLLLLALSVWCLASWWRIRRTLFDPYGLFFGAAALFNGGQAMLEVFHVNPSGLLDNRFSSETTLGTVLLASLGLASLHLGALLAIRRPPPQGAGWEPDVADLRWSAVALIGVSLLPSLAQIRQALPIVMSGGYFALFQQEGTTGFAAAPRVFAAFLVPGALFLLASSRGRPLGVAASALLIATYAALSLFLGMRATAVMPLIAFAWLWHRAIRPIPRWLLLVGGAVVLFVVFPFVRETRGLAGDQRLSPEVLVQSFFDMDNPVLAIVHEMGGTMKVLAHTLDLVPVSRDYEYGLGYAYALLALVPNVAWEIHPTIAHGLPAAWLIQTVEPAVAARGGGLGFSFIAEAYLNGGWLGLPLVLSLIGWLFVRLVQWAERPEALARQAMLASFLAFFLFFARAEASGVVRALAWYAFLPYALARLLAACRERFNPATLSGSTLAAPARPRPR